jgi:ArsR family transcriptional regulator
MKTESQYIVEADGDRCEEGVIHADAVRRARVAMPSPAVATLGAEIGGALADPTRFRLIGALAEGEMCVCDLAAALGMQQSAVSHQLRLLRHLGLVRTRREGRVVYYALDDDHVLAIFRQILDHVAHGRGGHGAARISGT